MPHALQRHTWLPLWMRVNVTCWLPPLGPRPQPRLPADWSLRWLCRVTCTCVSHGPFLSPEPRLHGRFLGSIFCWEMRLAWGLVSAGGGRLPLRCFPGRLFWGIGPPGFGPLPCTPAPASGTASPEVEGPAWTPEGSSTLGSPVGPSSGVADGGVTGLLSTVVSHPEKPNGCIPWGGALKCA